MIRLWRAFKSNHIVIDTVLIQISPPDAFGIERIASANGFLGFFASILPENTSMLQLCKKCYSDIKIEDNGDEIEIWMQFKKE